MRLRAAALALAALTACKPKTTADAGAPTRRAVRPVAATPAGPAPGRGAQIFVDVSESNRGFTGNGSRALATLHAQVIEASLSALQRNNPFVRCTVDNEVHCGRPGITAQQLAAAAVYRGSNANLHLALRRPPRAPRADLQQPDPLDPYAVTIVVTDGFQSTSAAFQPGVASDVACTAGADPSCLAALLRARVDEGYGLWVGRLCWASTGATSPSAGSTARCGRAPSRTSRRSTPTPSGTAFTSPRRHPVSPANPGCFASPARAP
jgi:hypothetical protein